MGRRMLLVCLLSICIALGESVAQYDMYEITIPCIGCNYSNPFTDAEIFATFSMDTQEPIQVRGFYDGEDIFKVRFMPHAMGEWKWITQSGFPALSGKTGTFRVGLASSKGPVRIRNYRSFEYADGSDHFSVGTTSYAWIHQNDSMIEDTLATLKHPETPFNKMRMTIFPKWYWFNKVDPTYYPYQGHPLTNWDFTKFNTTFWKRLDTRISQLSNAGVQADIILFHPYDKGHWGFDCMGGTEPDTYDTANDERYLKYTVARLGAYANVWWSMANEWDFVKCKSKGVPESSPIWDTLFRRLAAEDPYQHLTSIHNGAHLYNHSRPWITHISSQGGYDMAHIKRRYSSKPIVWDEVMYEGDIGNWGGLTAGQMADRFWWAASYGIYAGHGETVLYKNITDEDQVLWWSKGNILRGKSPSRIKWYKQVASLYFNSITCTCSGWGESLCDDSCVNRYTMGDGVNLATDERTIYILHSSGYNVPPHRPADSRLNLPPGTWALLPVDFWNMKILPATTTIEGGKTVDLIGSMLTFADLTTNDTLVPCGRSGASCCSTDANACTPYTALLQKISP